MRIATTPSPRRRTASALLTGLALFGGLWLLGAKDLAWVGFVVGGLVWAAVDQPATSTALVHRPPGMTPTSSTAVPEGVYDVLPSRTQVSLRMQKLRWLTVRATLSEVNARIDVGEEGITRVVGGLPAATFRSGSSRRDAHVVGRDFLNAREHPNICSCHARSAASTTGSARSPETCRSTAQRPT
jgi:polyisoprenoid-binding protein YceI